jgi:hypothetical protein
MNHLLRNFGANILILFLICGCVIPTRVKVDRCLRGIAGLVPACQAHLVSDGEPSGTSTSRRLGITPSRKVLPLSTKATPIGTWQLHRHPTIHADTSAPRELNDIEKDKLFRGFTRWLTVNRQGELGALVEAGQPPETDEEVRLPSN